MPALNAWLPVTYDSIPVMVFALGSMPLAGVMRPSLACSVTMSLLPILLNHSGRVALLLHAGLVADVEVLDVGRVAGLEEQPVA